MKRIGYNSLALLATVAFVAIASAAFAATPTPNGVVSNPRVYNDFPQSTSTWTNNYPSSVVFDCNVPFALSGWANSAYFELSGDGGVSKLLFPNACNYTYEADVVLSGTNVGNLEGGLSVQPFWTDPLCQRA